MIKTLIAPSLEIQGHDFHNNNLAKLYIKEPQSKLLILHLRFCACSELWVQIIAFRCLATWSGGIIKQLDV